MSMPAKRTCCALALLAGFVLVLASCGSNPSPPVRSGMYGIVVVTRGGTIPGNAVPSPLPGGFGPSLEVPYTNSVVVLVRTMGAGKGKVVARVEPNPQAIFWVTLPPGRYSLGIKGDRLPTAVTVRAGHYTPVTVQGPAHF